MKISLKDKRAIVCGSTQGIGKAIAMEMAAAGASVTLIARDEKKLQQVKFELSVAEKQIHNFIVADFCDAVMLKNKLDEFLKKHNRADILVNNTGGPAPGPIAEAKTEDLHDAFSSHVLCNQILAQAFLPSMKKENYGRIINIISTSVKEAIPGLGVSNTIRAAVANWAKTLAMEAAANGITVNNILPGFAKTQRLDSLIQQRAKSANKTIEEMEAEMKSQIPAGRFGTPEEIAYLAVFLASAFASYINGVSIQVDGGKTKCH